VALSEAGCSSFQQPYNPPIRIHLLSSQSHDLREPHSGLSAMRTIHPNMGFECSSTAARMRASSSGVRRRFRPGPGAGRLMSFTGFEGSPTPHSLIATANHLVFGTPGPIVRIPLRAEGLDCGRLPRFRMTAFQVPEAVLRGSPSTSGTVRRNVTVPKLYRRGFVTAPWECLRRAS